MLKSLGFFALWLLSTALAVAVAWAGVAVVDNELVRPAPANTLALRQADDAAPLANSAAADDGLLDVERTTALDAPPGGEGTDADAEAGALDAAPSVTSEPSTTRQPTTLPPTTAAATTSAPPTTSTTSAPTTAAAPTTTAAPTTAPPPPTTSTTSTSSTTTTTAAPGQTLTFHLVGGSTSISFSPAGATVLWASPNPGFDVDIDHGAQSRVEFESDWHETRIDAWWSAGPQHQIREDAD